MVTIIICVLDVEYIINNVNTHDSFKRCVIIIMEVINPVNNGY